MIAGRPTSDDRDRGSIIVMAAFAMMGLLSTMAIVIDLGYLRGDRGEARRAADAGATSGALALSNLSSSTTTCIDGLTYTFKNLGITADATTVQNACGGFSGPCTPGATRTATVTLEATTVTVMNPVVDGSALMYGTELGSGVNQAVTSTVDGADCDRVGVEVTRPQLKIFSGVISGASRSYKVHSVARYTVTRGPDIPTPALVALNRTTCGAIDAGTNGNIVLLANSAGPGVAFSDSNGPTCTSTNPILASKSSARMVAESFGNVIGELGWFAAPNTRGYNNGASTNQSVPAAYGTTNQNYVGQLIPLSERTTRQPVDDAFHCTNVSPLPPGCVTAADPINADQLAAASPTSYGYTTYAGPCDSVGGRSFTGKLWVKNCPTFTVKGGTLTVAAGSSVIFEGALSIEAGGNLYVNTAGGTDAGGYPLATDPARQTTLIVKSSAANAVNVQSTSVVIAMAQTMLYNFGGVTLQGSPVIRWTPPNDPSLYTKGLLYWSESTQPFGIQGGPTIAARGIVFHGNGPLTGGGGGTIDLRNVQMWVDTATTSGNTTLMLAADPNNSIGALRSLAKLIR